MIHSLCSSKRVLPALTAMVLLFSACKKKDRSGSGGDQFSPIPLGALVMDNDSPVGFNAAGDPIIKVNSYFYEWSETSKEWKKVGTAPVTGTVGEMAKDPQGNYYVVNNGRIITCTTGGWTDLVLPDTTMVPARILANGNGDIVVRASNGDSLYYFKKAASATGWVKIYAIAPWEESNYPSFFTNNGYIYYSYSSGGSIIYDYYLNTNTGTKGLIYDKTDPVNIPIGGQGYITAKMFIHPDGDIYAMDGNELFMLDMKSTPTTFKKVILYENPIRHSDLQWLSGLDAYVIDAAGNIKVVGGCNNYPSTHFSILSGNLKSNTLQILSHPASLIGIMSNPRGRILVFQGSGSLYWWK